MFYLLEENRYIGTQLTEQMVNAVGFRNPIVHEYARVELTEVFEVAHKDVEDLNEYLKSILEKVGITQLNVHKSGS